MFITTFIFLFLLSVVAVEAMTGLLTVSLFFSGFRDWFSSRGEFFEELISCGYCTSVWVAILPAVFLSCFQVWISPLVAFLIFWLALHRMANYLHGFNDKWLDKRYSKE